MLMDKPYMPGSDPYYEEEPIDMPAGRPPIYTPNTRVCLAARGDTKLQERSERRAIVQAVVDRAGCATLKELEDHFGYDVQHIVQSLIYTGWLEVRP
jgi:hypothetical protein